MNAYIVQEDERFFYLNELMKNKFEIVDDINLADIIVLGIKDTVVPKCIKKDAVIVSYFPLNTSNNLVLSYSERYLLKNAHLTAVACINKLDLNNKKVVIYGNGRIASFLKRYIHQSMIICRHPKEDEYSLDSDLYETADVIINTIPSHLPVNLTKLKNNVQIIDLASSPYGFDYGEIKEFNINIELWSGLPAKCFPLEAAYLIYEEVIKCLQEKRLA